jgi:hypothetical protein
MNIRYPLTGFVLALLLALLHGHSPAHAAATDRADRLT